MQDFVNHINALWELQKPFVAYHFAEENKLCSILPKDSNLHYLQDFEESGFIFSPFNMDSQPILFPESSSEVINYQLNHVEIESSDEFKVIEQAEEKQSYLRLLSHTIEQIQAEKFKKVVVSRKISAIYNLKHPAELLLKLIQFYPEAFTYIWFHPEVGFWAGASPETLIKTYRSQLETMSLAGTKRVEESREWTAKERDEQQIVTDEIESALQPFVSRLNISETYIDRAGELLHLRTDLKAHYKNTNFGDILKALHPTPAVCGLPKEKAFQFLQANESYDRQFYTGFFGELNMPRETQRSARTKNQENQAYKSIARTSNLFVNLRCMSYSDNTINIYVGGGITKDSNPEDEWVETQHKSKTMLKVL